MLVVVGVQAIELPQPLGIIFLWAVLLPGLFIVANALTQLAFKDALIIKVFPCSVLAFQLMLWNSFDARTS